ncbi:hypothetical protein GCM10010168_83800 [Actinoplanes ianthinogenes]|uniref:hypothetical protein n=1 Tax=Actinoplanes ianthinogenes TaxID=122358 RepID=UPI0019C7422D|nr:hypothetical protein GCM10010168_83800 [Actinoplanes ianthinogenes]
MAEAAATMKNAVKAAGSGLAPAPRPVSTATTAAQAAQKAWLADLRRLTGQADEYGTSLITSARTYRATDQSNAHELRSSGAGVAQ